MPPKYTIKEGTRMVGFQASYAQVWAITWANIFVDCMQCDQSIGLRMHNDQDVNTFPDEEFLKIVRERGWVVEPGKKILCPKCQEAHVPSS